MSKKQLTIVYVKGKKSKSDEELKKALEAKKRAIDILAQLAISYQNPLASMEGCRDEGSIIC